MLFAQSEKSLGSGLAERITAFQPLRRQTSHFKENVTRIVTTEELRYVEKSKEFPRRICELRTEEGYSIATFYTGRPDLRPGEYGLLYFKGIPGSGLPLVVKI